MKIGLQNAEKLPAPARRPSAIAAACRAALGPAARRAGEVNVVFLARGPMRRLNREYLGHDYDTDVIAFNYRRPQGAGSSSGPEAKASPDAPFGDILVSIHQARRQARELGHPLLTELLTLTVHGALHLMGYRDGTPAERRRMFARQERVLRRVLRG